MKVSKQQLRKLIKEEKQKLLKEQGFETGIGLIEFAQAYSSLGRAVQEQVDAVVGGYVNYGGSDRFYEIAHEQNPNAIQMALDKLRLSLLSVEAEDAGDVMDALRAAQSITSE